MSDKIDASPLTSCFGVKIHNLNIAEISPDTDYPALRALFEEHSALLFTGQNLSPDDHLRLAQMFGPVEDRKKDERAPGAGPEVALVSNVTSEGLTGEMDLHTLHLKANQQWHIDSTFMPVPSLCNILTAKVVSTSGGQTELASTRAAWAVMPEALKARIRGRILGHNYRRSRERLSMELANLPMFNKWPPQHWPAVWPNPVNGREALYIASHVFEVLGMEKAEGEALIDELIAFCTEPRFSYSHDWTVGDVMIWDQRAVMHRGMPWPYDQPRTLASVCCSMSDGDGLAEARRRAAEMR
jgi:alpha-ketoglutarate-dependent 2,4-dichlorophenoxyacetate dioxygenase